MAVGAAAVFVGATLFGANEAKKREKRIRSAQEQAGRVEQAIATQQARKARRAQIREARVRQAQIENLAAAGGQTESSAAVGATGSLAAQLGENLGSINTALAQGMAKTQAEMDIFKAGEKKDFERVANVTADISSRFIGG